MLIKITQRENTRTVGRVQISAWDASCEQAFLDDPLLVLKPREELRELLKRYQSVNNTIVQTSVAGFGYGLNLLRDLLAGDQAGFPTYVAWGTNGTAPTVNDASLYSEVARNAVVARSKGNKQLTIGGFMGSTTGNGNTIAEVALVTGLTSEQWRLFARAAILAIPKNSSTVISLSWEITFA